MKFANKSLYLKILALLAVPFALQIVLLFWYGTLISSVQDLEEKQYRSRQILGHANWIHARTYAAIVGRVGEQATAQPGYGELFSSSEENLRRELPKFRNLLESDSGEAAKGVLLQSRVTGLLDRLHSQSFDQKTDPEFKALLQDPAISTALTDIPTLRHQILAKEQEITGSDAQQLSRMLGTIKEWIYFFVLFDIFVSVLLIYAFTKNVVARINVVSDNSLRLARREPLLPPVAGEDEIAALDQMFRHNAAIITELSRRERAILENTVDVICSLSSDGRFTQVSPASQQAWGFASDELLGRALLDIVSADTKVKTATSFEQALKQSLPIRFENTIVGKDGKEIYSLWSCSWSEEEKSIYAVAHDITERKQIELQKQEFLAMISHDLRTPLSSLLNFLELSCDGVYGELPQKMQVSSARMLKNVERLIAMINEFLELQKIESGADTLDFHKVKISEVLSNAISLVCDLADARKITIECEKTDVFVMADPERLTHVFLNLISNAIKFSQNSIVKIYSSVQNKTVEISVADSGKGIGKESQELIFQRFKQADKADSKSGTGLGLAICKAIIEQHEGTVGVESELGRGSRFYVRLPVAPSGHAPVDGAANKDGTQMPNLAVAGTDGAELTNEGTDSRVDPGKILHDLSPAEKVTVPVDAGNSIDIL